MLLTNFRAEYRDRLLTVLWRQWTALGVAGSQQGWNASVVDPDALLLITCSIVRSDPRLFDAVLEWLRLNGHYINVQRVKRMLREEVFVGESVLKAVADATSTSVSQSKWAKLASGHTAKPDGLESLFFLSSGDPLPVLREEDEGFARYGFAREQFIERGVAELFCPESPSSLLLRLRALFGVNARCDVLQFLLVNSIGSPRVIARDCYYFPATISKAMAEMSQSGFLVSTTEGRRRCYRLTPDTWRELFLGSAPKLSWIVWARLFSALEQIWLFLDSERLVEKPVPVQASALRRILKRKPLSRLEGKGRSIVFGDDSVHTGEALIPFFITRTRLVLDWLEDECSEV